MKTTPTRPRDKAEMEQLHNWMRETITAAPFSCKSGAVDAVLQQVRGETNPNIRMFNKRGYSRYQKYDK